MQSSTYRLELSVNGEASSQTEMIVPSVAAVRTFVAKSLVPNSVLIATHLKHDADYGNFITFLGAIGLAYGRVLEHRRFHATSPQATVSGKKVQFVDDGNTFDVEENSTSSSAIAVEALEHWLATDERVSVVRWVDE